MIQACIKCREQYEEPDDEAYLCSKCLELKKAIADKIDAQMAHLPKIQPMSGLAEYEQAEKVRGFMRVS